MKKIKAFAFDATSKIKGWKWYTVLTVLMIAVALAATATVIYYICGPMEGELHADFTDTILWADATYVSGKVFNPDFAYAGLLPFSANLWFVPLIAMFGVSMKTQVIGMIIFALVFIGAVYFMCRSAKWSIPWTMFTITSLLMIFCSSAKLREIMWGHVIYYSLILVLLFVSIGIALRLLRRALSQTAKCVIGYSLAALWFLLVATNGVQIFAMVILPVAGGMLADVFFDNKRKIFDNSHIKTIFIALGFVAFGLIGLKYLSILKGGISAEYAEGHLKLSNAIYWDDHLLKLSESWFSLLGADGTFEELPIIEVGARAAAGMVVAVLPLILLFNYKKIEDDGTKLILWSHVLVSAVTLGGWIFGNLSGANWRLTSMLGTSVVASIAAVRFFALRKGERDGYSLKRLSAVLAVGIVLLSLVSFKTVNEIPADYNRDNTLHRLTDKLEDEGLTYGYATFWRSQAITLLSDSKVQTMMIRTDLGKGVWTDYYQNYYSNYKGKEGIDKYFVLLSSYEKKQALENDEWAEFVDNEDPETIYFEDFIIYVFDKNLTFDIPEGK